MRLLRSGAILLPFIVFFCYVRPLVAQQYCIDGVLEESKSDLFKAKDRVQFTASVSAAPPCLVATKEEIEQGAMSTCTVLDKVVVTLKTPSHTWTSTRGTLQINQTSDDSAFFIVEAVPLSAPGAPNINLTLTLLFGQSLIAEKKIPKAPLPILDVSRRGVRAFGDISFGGEDLNNLVAARFKYTGNCGQQLKRPNCEIEIASNSSAIPNGCPAPAPEDPCPALIAEVGSNVTEVSMRFVEMLQDTQNLYIRAYDKPAPGINGTWKGHQEAYNKARERLEKSANRAKKAGCELPRGTEYWINREPPTNPNP